MRIIFSYFGFPPLYFPFALASAIPCFCVSSIYLRSSSAWQLYNSIIKLLSNRRRLSSVIPVNAGKLKLQALLYSIELNSMRFNSLLLRPRRLSSVTTTISSSRIKFSLFLEMLLDLYPFHTTCQ